MSSTEPTRDQRSLTVKARGPRWNQKSADLFPVIRSILSPEALLRTVTGSYAIGAPTDCRLLKRGLNDTYLLTTAGGPFILRVYRAGWRSREEIQYELELLRHLAAKSVGVAVPVAARGDRLTLAVTAPEGTRHVVLFTYADGKRAAWSTPDDAYLLGTVAGAIHTGTDDFVSRYTRTPLDLKYLIDDPLAAIRPFLAHRPADWVYLEAFAARLKAGLAEHVARGLDWGVCHGDFGPKNIHMGNGQSLTVFDFDLCGPGWRAFDLGLIRWVAMDHHDEDLWQAFLNGYGDTRPLSPVDVTAVPLFNVAGHLSSLGLFAENIGDWGAADMSDWLFDRELNFFRAWESGKV